MTARVSEHPDSNGDTDETQRAPKHFEIDQQIRLAGVQKYAKAKFLKYFSMLEGPTNLRAFQSHRCKMHDSGKPRTVGAWLDL